MSSVLRGRVRIGAVDAVEPFDVDGALAAFTCRYPGIALRLRTEPTGAELLAAIDGEELDLVLAPAPRDLPDKYSAHTLFTEQLVVITAVDHRLARTGSVALTELGDQPYLVESGARLVGIDSVNIDDTAGGHRPAHTVLLAAEIPVVEHLTGLDRLPISGATFTAVPAAVRGMATFPVRAFASVP